MKQTHLVLLAIVVVSALTLGMIFSFGLTSERLVAQIETVPGQNQDRLSLQQATSVWHEAYDLELTGTDIHPDQVSFDIGRAAVLDTLANRAMLIDITTKNFTRLPQLPENTTAILADEGDVYIYAQGLYEWDERKETWTALAISLETPGKVTQIRLFDGNFYAFGVGFVRKLTFSVGKFTGNIDWLDEETTFVDAPRDVYLDGYVYLSSSDGLTRYLRGRPTTWYPEATLSATLYLDGDGQERLFVLDGERGNLLTFNLQGELIAESPDNILPGARFLSFQPDVETVFTLIGQKIYQYDADLVTVNSGQTISD